jgi:hypothetical protein
VKVILEEINKYGKYLNFSNKICFSCLLVLANWWANLIKTNPLYFRDNNGCTAIYWGI